MKRKIVGIFVCALFILSAMTGAVSTNVLTKTNNESNYPYNNGLLTTETNTGWIGPYDSGQKGSAKHTWDEQNNYFITVKAKDIYGLESDWSDPLLVSMPRNRAVMNVFFLRFLEKLSDHFPILEWLLSIQ